MFKLKTFINEQVLKDNKHIMVNLCATLAVIIILKLGIKKFKKVKKQRQMKLQALKKYQEVLEDIKFFQLNHLKDFKLDPQLKDLIINSNVTGLKKMEFEGKVTVQEVLLTFIERTINYGIKNNWLADVCFKEALSLAKQQDQEIRNNRQIIYKEGNDLFGIPVTFKDMFIVKGYDASCGLTTLCNKPYNYDGYQSYAIKQAGGIIFAKTNNPQCGYAFETNNFIYGRGKNPYNPDYTTGGSTGGEGGMISCRCSILGMGSDIGGSIRFPASFNGIYGLKPCTKRILIKGQVELHPILSGYRNLQVSNGPLARDVDDLAVIMRVLLDEQKYKNAPLISKDIHFQPIPFNEKEFKTDRKLKIGYFKQVDFFPSCAANKRAVMIAIDSLKEQGHEVVEITIENLLLEAYQISMFFIQADNQIALDGMLDGEKSIPEYNKVRLGLLLPMIIRKIILQILKAIRFNRDIVAFNPLCKDMKASDYLLLSNQQGIVQQKMAQFWSDNNLDALICPVSAGVALKHEQTSDCFATLIYTMSWNVLDYTCGSVPITIVQADETHYRIVDQFAARDANVKVLEEAMKDAQGLPVSVQVITRPLKVELCLQIMQNLQKLINFNHPPNII